MSEKVSNAIDPESTAWPTSWLVDGYNVLRVTLTRGGPDADWWTAPRRQRLLALAALLGPLGPQEGESDPHEVCVVFDGRHLESSEEHVEPSADAAGRRVTAVYAQNADDWILERLAAKRADAAHTLVVSADRALVHAARQRGAKTMTPGDFVALCTRGRAPGEALGEEAPEPPGWPGS